MGLLDGIIGGVSKLFDFGASHYETNRMMHFAEDMQKNQQLYNTSEREAAQQYNTGEREATQDWNLAMWNKNNEYNSPAAQMERLQSAGLSPAAAAQAVAGQGSAVSQPVASSAQSSQGASSGIASAPGWQNSGVFNMGPTEIAQLKIMDEQAKNIAADTEQKQSQTSGQNIENYWKPYILNESIQKMRKESDKLIADMHLSEEKAREVKYNVDNILPLLRDKTQQDVNQAYVGWLQMIEQLENIKEERKLIQEKQNTEKAQQGVLGAQQGLLSSQKQGVDYDNAGKKVIADWANRYGILMTPELQDSFLGMAGNPKALEAFTQCFKNIAENPAGGAAYLGSKAGQDLWKTLVEVVGPGQAKLLFGLLKNKSDGPTLRNGTSTTYNYYGGNSGLNTNVPFGH